MPVGTFLVEENMLISENHNRGQQQHAVIFLAETHCVCNTGLYDG